MTNDQLISDFLRENHFKPGGHAMLEAALAGLLDKAVEVNAAAWEKERKLRISDRDYTKDLKRKHAALESECNELKKRVSEWAIVCDEFDSIKAESVRLREALEDIQKHASAFTGKTSADILPRIIHVSESTLRPVQPSTQPADGKTT